MIEIPAGLQAKLASGATTLAWCWRVTRRDGQVFGFTDHDRALSFEGTSYEPGAGLSPGALRAEAGFAPARAAAFGALTSEAIEAADLDNGLWDGAKVEIFRADWSDPALRWRAATGEIGAITRSETGFEAEVEGLTARLNRRIGRVFSSACDAELGDARCGVDLSDPAYAGSGSVVEVIEPHALDVDGLDGFAEGWFAAGVLVWTSGVNQGARQRVARHETGRIELERAPARLVAPGDGFAITAGCDKRAGTCRTKFANFLSFRGHPHMPGNDVLLRHPASETRRDGGKR